MGLIWLQASSQGWAPLAALPKTLALSWSLVMLVASMIYTFHHRTFGVIRGLLVEAAGCCLGHPGQGSCVLECPC